MYNILDGIIVDIDSSIQMKQIVKVSVHQGIMVKSEYLNSWSGVHQDRWIVSNFFIIIK